jgi:hypothetical protein
MDDRVDDQHVVNHWTALSKRGVIRREALRYKNKRLFVDSTLPPSQCQAIETPDTDRSAFSPCNSTSSSAPTSVD